VIALVGNDAGWTQIEREQVPVFGSNVACGLSYTGEAVVHCSLLLALLKCDLLHCDWFADYHVVADGYGGKGFLMQRGTDISETLNNAVKISRDEQLPVLVNALIGKTSFRDGSISV